MCTPEAVHLAILSSFCRLHCNEVNNILDSPISGHLIWAGLVNGTETFDSNIFAMLKVSLNLYFKHIYWCNKDISLCVQCLMYDYFMCVTCKKFLKSWTWTHLGPWPLLRLPISTDFKKLSTFKIQYSSGYCAVFVLAFEKSPSLEHGNLDVKFIASSQASNDFLLNASFIRAFRSECKKVTIFFISKITFGWG